MQTKFEKLVNAIKQVRMVETDAASIAQYEGLLQLAKKYDDTEKLEKEVAATKEGVKLEEKEYLEIPTCEEMSAMSFDDLAKYAIDATTESIHALKHLTKKTQEHPMNHLRMIALLATLESIKDTMLDE
jgi:hypothetical protein